LNTNKDVRSTHAALRLSSGLARHLGISVRSLDAGLLE